MTRVLKFRAWDKDYKEYSYSVNNRLDDFFASNDGPDYEYEQFTGLKDSKGVEIYEGDIVVMDYEGMKAEIVWAEIPPEFYMKPLDWDRWIEDWNLADDYGKSEVIGNIHQHPELLTAID